MGKSTIEWTDVTWNPVTGCTKVSPGCAHCYAERMARRLAGRCGYPEAPNHFDVTLHPERLEEPLHWRKPRRVFVCSMSDLFHEDVPFEYIDAVFAVMAAAPQHTFQVLTKRAKRMYEYFDVLHERAQRFPAMARRGVDYETGRIMEMWRFNLDYYDPLHNYVEFESKLPLPNVWIGVTAENQEQADKRIPDLLQCPAAVRFVSVEPMLGPVILQGGNTPEEPSGTWPDNDYYDFAYLRGVSGDRRIDWVICGGETGPGARPMHPDWVRDLRDQCNEAGVPFFFKQWGAWLPYGQDITEAEWESDTFERFQALIDSGVKSHSFGDGEYAYRVCKKRAGRLLDGRTWNEYPVSHDNE